MSSGAGLLHYNQSVPVLQASPRRRVLFLHGNTGSLDDFVSSLDLMDRLGYDVYALEYAGYLPLMASPPVGTVLVDGQYWQQSNPSGDTILQNVCEAWSLMGDSNTIVVGFSLGGGALGMVYDRLIPSPAQIVFLNTFFSLPQLIVEVGAKFWIPTSVSQHCVAPFMKTQWWCQRPQRYTGRVLIVYTK